MNLPAMSEDELQAQVEQFARGMGWLVYHTRDSRRSERGFPDLVLVHPHAGATLFVELKRDGEHPTPDQWRWLRALALRGAVFVWRPLNWRTGEVGRALRRWGLGHTAVECPGRVAP